MHGNTKVRHQSASPSKGMKEEYVIGAAGE